MPCTIIAKVPGGTTWRKGEIVRALPADHVFGSKEIDPSRFIIIDVSDASQEEVVQYEQEWRQDLDFDVLNSNPSIDGHRLLLWTTNRSATGVGDITRAKAVRFLTLWGAVNIVTGTRPTGEAGVRFDLTVTAAATSEGFWGADAGSFEELGYTQQGGIHDIRWSYPARFRNRPGHAALLDQVGERAEVTASDPDARTIDFRVTRSDVFAAFKASLKMALENFIRRRRAHLDHAEVDAVVAAGGRVTRTFAELRAMLRDSTTG